MILYIIHHSLFRVLRKGGRLICMGFLFEDDKQRREFKTITKVKDRLAGMDKAVKDRFFSTRQEWYACLKATGFINIKQKRLFDYVIDTKIAAEEYFKEINFESEPRELRNSILQANSLIQAGRIQIRMNGAYCKFLGKLLKPTDHPNGLVI